MKNPLSDELFLLLSINHPGIIEQYRINPWLIDIVPKSFRFSHHSYNQHSFVVNDVEYSVVYYNQKFDFFTVNGLIVSFSEADTLIDNVDEHRHANHRLFYENLTPNENLCRQIYDVNLEAMVRVLDVSPLYRTFRTSLLHTTEIEVPSFDKFLPMTHRGRLNVL